MTLVLRARMCESYTEGISGKFPHHFTKNASRGVDLKSITDGEQYIRGGEEGKGEGERRGDDREGSCGGCGAVEARTDGDLDGIGVAS